MIDGLNMRFQTERPDGSMSIVGIATLDERYKGLEVKGMVTRTGPVVVETCCAIDGTLQCPRLSAREARIRGDVTVGEIESSAAHIEGNASIETLRVGTLELSGKGKIGSILPVAEQGAGGTEVSVSGVYRIGSVEAERFEFFGVINGTSIVGREVHITLDGGQRSSLEAVSASDSIEVSKKQGTRSSLTANEIKSRRVDIEYVTAKRVEGVDVTIGEGCVIDCVQYSGNLTVAPGATVKESKKL